MSLTIATILGTVGLLALWGLSRPKDGSGEAKLSKDGPALDISEVAAQWRLAKSGQFVLRTFRQSGNPHQEDRLFDRADAAVAAALSTFRRAKVDMITIIESTADEFSFRRSVPDFRGRNEGRRLHRIEIHRVQGLPWQP